MLNYTSLQYFSLNCLVWLLPCKSVFVGLHLLLLGSLRTEDVLYATFLDADLNMNQFS
jgi:hypothetical protein